MIHVAVYPITSTIIAGTFSVRPEIREKVHHGRKDDFEYDEKRPDKWFGAYNHWARIILISMEDVPVDETGFEVFEDPRHPYDKYRIGIKTPNFADTRNIYQEIRTILKSELLSSSYNRVEIPEGKPIERRGVTYIVVVVKCLKVST